jgi:hypothetical protein
VTLNAALKSGNDAALFDWDHAGAVSVTSQHAHTANTGEGANLPAAVPLREGALAGTCWVATSLAQ